MPTTHYINVTWTPGDEYLKVEPKQVDLAGPLDHWIWDFYGIPNNYFPQVQFLTDPQGETRGPYGPFQSLCQTCWRIIGSGNTGVVGSYPYEVLMTPALADASNEAPPSIRSNPRDQLAVTNNDPKRTLQDIQVTLEDTPDGPRLVVVPEMVCLISGQSITWRFDGISGVADPWYPSIEFIDVPEGVVNIHLGPFSSMQQFDTRVVGLGNSFFPGQYGYIAVLKHETTHGVIHLSSKDPAIGNEGNPPGGGGGSNGGNTSGGGQTEI